MADIQINGISQIFESYRRAIVYGKKKTAENAHRARNRVARPEVAGNITQLEVKYKRWKKAVLALFRLYDLRESELAMLVYLACRGEARETLDILEIDEMLAPHGMEMIWELLDEAFDKLVIEKYEEASAEYNEVYRKYGMSMDQYITGLKRAKRELLSQDQKSVISDKAFAQKMLKNSNIGHDNRMQVFFNAGSKYRSKRIEAVLRLQYSRVHERDRRLGKTFKSTKMRKVHLTEK